MTASSVIDFLKEFLRGDGGTHTWFPRFLVALWGCLVLHVAIVVVGSAQGHVDISIIDFNLLGLYILISVLAYSSTFAAIIAFGIREGSLVRHFVYGAMLPTFTYLVAGLVSELLRE